MPGQDVMPIIPSIPGTLMLSINCGGFFTLIFVIAFMTVLLACNVYPYIYSKYANQLLIRSKLAKSYNIAVLHCTTSPTAGKRLCLCSQARPDQT
jgi:hypothetical protein